MIKPDCVEYVPGNLTDVLTTSYIFQGACWGPPYNLQFQEIMAGGNCTAPQTCSIVADPHGLTLSIQPGPDALTVDTHSGAAISAALG